MQNNCIKQLHSFEINIHKCKADVSFFFFFYLYQYMYLNVLLDYLLNTLFCYKNGLLPFNKSYEALIQNLTLSPFFFFFFKY